MKHVIVIVIVLLVIALCAPSAWADRMHVVKEGENLSKIARVYGVRWQEIQKANGLKKTIIRAGQKLVIPEPGTRVAPKTAAGRVWKKVGGNPYKGTAKWAIQHFSLPEDVKAQVLANYRQGQFNWVTIRSGQELSAVTFGRNQIWTDVTTSWDSSRLHAAQDYGVGEWRVVRVLTCGNWAWWKELPPPPPPVVEAPPEPEPPPLPPIFQKVSVEKACVSCEHELDAGAGKWWNEDFTADGWWWFAQYKNFLSNCGRFQKDAFGGTITPIVGIFARGDLGDNDWGYEWNNWGIGPQVGAMWNGITSEGYPQQVQLLARLLYEDMHGKNSSSGYHKDEEHVLLGYYAEYLRRFAPDKMNVFYTEGWFDLNESFDSTWSGDSASDRTGFAAGYKFHKDWNANWASRFGLQVGLLPQDDQWGANANIEMRYNDWLIFGPSFDYVIASDVAGVAGGWAFGPFVRVELHHQVQKKWTETRMEQVQSAGQELLKY